MSERNHPLLQRLWIQGQELELGNVYQFTYIEGTDLSAPIFILEYKDEHQALRGSGLLAHNAIVKCELADGYNLDTDFFSEEFVISAFPIKDSIIQIQGFQRQCHDLKQPALKAKFYVDKSPKQILQHLCPDLEVVTDVERGTGTYHLNTGTTPAKLINNMMRDYGATCWISRGTCYFVTYEYLLRQPRFKRFVKNAKDGDIVMNHYEMLNNDALFERVMHKHWITVTVDKGLIESREHQDKPKSLLPSMSRLQLANQSKHLQPRIDIVTFGYSDLKAGQLIDVEMKKEIEHGAIDESVESQMIVTRVAHCEKRLNYNMRVELGVFRE